MTQSTFEKKVDRQTADEAGGRELSDFIERLDTLNDLVGEIKRATNAKALIIKPFSQVFEDVLAQSGASGNMGCSCSKKPKKSCLCRHIAEIAEPLSIIRLNGNGKFTCRLLGDCSSYVSMPLPSVSGKPMGILNLSDTGCTDASVGAALRAFGGLMAEILRISSAFRVSAARSRIIGELSHKVACILLSSKTADYSKVLELLGSTLETDSCYIITKGCEGSDSHEIYEWCADGAKSAAGDMFSTVGGGEFDAPLRLCKIDADEGLYIPNVGDMTGEQSPIVVKLRANGVRSALFAPIRNCGETLGIIGFHNIGHSFIGDGAIKGLAREICKMLGIYINRRRSDATAKRWKAVDILLKDLDRKILNNHSVDELLKGFCDQLSGTLGYPAIIVLLYEEGGKVQTAVSNAALSSLLYGRLEKFDVPAFREWCLGEDLKSGQPRVISKNGSSGQAFGSWTTVADEIGLQTAVSIPLMVEGNSIGVLIIGARTFDEFEDETNIGILSGFAAQLSISLTSARHQQQIRYLAEHDSLTNLYNRHSFEESLASFHKETLGGAKGAVLLLDLDNFKIVNDTFGHQVGDILLKEFADFLRAEVGGTGIVARLGGDEFGILYEYENYEYIQSTVKSLIDNMEKFTFRCEGIKCNLTASMGLMPVDGSLRVNELLAMVDSALYEAKDRGKNQLVSLGEVDSRDSVGLKSLESSRLALEIQEAIADKRFVLHFQPVFRTDGGIPEYYEALIRMVGKDGGLVMPGAFIPVAEHFDMMKRIDRWTVETVLKILEHNSDIKIFINISGASLKDGDLLRLVETSITGGRLKGSQLTFEITESVVVKDLEGVQRWMAQLKQLGCSFSLDDFGSGFSSLSYLHRLPVDYIKIDGSFIKGLDIEPESKAIVKSIASVSHALGKSVIAEHVESGTVNDIVKELGIKYSQGFYWKRPGPMDWPVT